MRILGAVIIAAGLLLFAQFQYLPALICIVIGAVFMGKPRAPKLEEDEEADGKTDSELVRVDAPLTKVRSVSGDHRRLAFPVDGVMKNNDDGSSRQNALRKLCEGEDMMVVEVWFDDYLFGGKLKAEGAAGAEEYHADVVIIEETEKNRPSVEERENN